VLEIVPHKHEIDPKYHFLCEAPQKDPDGRPAVIRYSRKTKEQYVQSEVDGKPTGWKAFYDGGVEGRRQALIDQGFDRGRWSPSRFAGDGRGPHLMTART
jgi:hypothetical protein